MLLEKQLKYQGIWFTCISVPSCTPVPHFLNLSRHPRHVSLSGHILLSHFPVTPHHLNLSHCPTWSPCHLTAISWCIVSSYIFVLYNVTLTHNIFMSHCPILHSYLTAPPRPSVRPSSHHVFVSRPVPVPNKLFLVNCPMVYLCFNVPSKLRAAQCILVPLSHHIFPFCSVALPRSVFLTFPLLNSVPPCPPVSFGLNVPS